MAGALPCTGLHPLHCPLPMPLIYRPHLEDMWHHPQRQVWNLGDGEILYFSEHYLPSKMTWQGLLLFLEVDSESHRPMLDWLAQTSDFLMESKHFFFHFGKAAYTKRPFQWFMPSKVSLLKTGDFKKWVKASHCHLRAVVPNKDTRVPPMSDLKGHLWLYCIMFSLTVLSCTKYCGCCVPGITSHALQVFTHVIDSPQQP